MLLHTERLNILSEKESVSGAEFALIGVPFDSTESNVSGQRMAPNDIREFFLAQESGDATDKVYDAGNIIAVHGNAEKTLEKVTQTVEDLLRENASVRPIMLGGEHTITLGAIRALKEKHKDLQVISLDAHYDLKDDFRGEKISHSTVMRRISELGVKVIIIGARAGSDDEKEFSKKVGLSMRDADPKKPTYLSIDLDVIDPAIMPGVGDPEPDGFTAKRFFDILDSIKRGFSLVGVDIVEANPMIERQATCAFAAKCLMMMLG